jgi:hypothetical protein
MIYMSKNIPTKPTLPYAPTYRQAGGDTVPQTEAERESGLLAKIHLGKVALVGAALHVPGAVASIGMEEPAMLASGTMLTALVAGQTFHSAHNYFKNDYTPQAPINRLIKAKTLEKRSTASAK